MSNKRLNATILSYFEKEGEKDEKLKLVAETLKNYVNSEEKSDYSLSEIFEEGEKILKEKKPIQKQEPKKKQETQSLDNDPKFKEFLDAITKKGYFGDFQPGTQEHKSRLEKAKDRYLLKLEENKKKSEEFKEQGNQFTKEKKFTEAITAYKKGIEVYPTAILYSNLSYAYLQLKDDENALTSALQSVKIDPTYAKGYARVATSYYNLSKYEEALEYINKALELDSNNKQWVEIKQDLEKRVKPKKSTQQSGGNSGFDPSMLSGMFGGQGGLDLGSLMNNPQFMNMATSMLSNPQVMQQMQQMMGSFMGGQTQPVPKESIEKLKSMDDYKNSSKIKKFVDDLEENGLGVITKYMGEAEVQQFVMKMAQESFNGENPFSGFGGFGGGGNNQNDDPDTSNLYL